MRVRRVNVGRVVRQYPMYARYGVVDTRALGIKLGDPSVIIFKKRGVAYVIYSPYTTETAQSLSQLLSEHYSVTMVNGASDPRADELQRWAIKVYSHLSSLNF